MDQRLCAICTSPFTPARRTTSTCSRPCARILARRNERERRLADPANEHTCPQCGECFRSYQWNPPKYCSPACVGAANRDRQQGRAAPHLVAAARRAKRRRRAARKVTIVPSLGGAWVAGPCAHCGTPFVATCGQTRYCSSLCRHRAQNARVAPSPTLNKRLRILNRDGWRCWICERPIDPTLLGTVSSEAPSVDHHTPRILGGSNADENLRAAHLGCNSRRGAPGHRRAVRPTGGTAA